MSTLRIMHVSTRLIIGGSQENTILSCAGQAARGHAVSLVYGPIYGPEGSLLDRARSYGSFETIETPDLVRELAPLRDWRCRRALRRLIETWKPDVVHTHSSKAGILGRDAAWAERVPCVVHTIHGLAFHPFGSRWRNALYVVAERRAAKHCHRIVGVADAMCEQALAAGIGRREQYATIYSGMEVERYLSPGVDRRSVRRELGIPEDAFVLGTIARLAELKGHDDLLDALSGLMRDEPRLVLLWVGDGWWRERLLGRVAEDGLGGRVVTTGLVPPDQIPKYLTAMDALAHPSYREGLPRAVVQALLAAVPVIAYDVDGTREVVIEGETGFLLEPHDVEGLERAVRRLLEHGEARRAMGERGRALCRGRFSAETMVERLLSLYEEVLGRREGASR